MLFDLLNDFYDDGMEYDDIVNNAKLAILSFEDQFMKNT